MADHRKLKTYTTGKKNPKELKRSRPICAEQILQVSDSEGSGYPSSEPHGMGRKSSTRDKDKKGSASGGGTGASSSGRVGPVKERWLLTRKTWKYMALAGRRLIPDGTHNRLEDIPRINEHFQHICRTEQKFLMCSRKSSYPGAISVGSRFRRRGASSSSKSGSRHSRSHQSTTTTKTGAIKASSADEAEDESKAYDQNAEMVIKLLHSYLNILETGPGDKRDGTVARGQQQQSGEQQGQQQSQQQQQAFGGEKKLSQQQQQATQRQQQSQAGTQTLANVSSDSIPIPPPRSHNLAQTRPLSTDSAFNLTQRTSELLESLRSYSQATNRPVISPDRITSDLLGNKTLLRKIYNDLKQQQLSIVLNRHTPSSSNTNLSHAASLTSLLNFRRALPKTPTAIKKSTSSSASNTSATIGGGGRGSPSSASSTSLSTVGLGSSGGVGSGSSSAVNRSSEMKLPKEKYERSHNQLVPFISVKKPAKTYATQGTQTNFLQLHQIDNMRKEYELRKKEYDLMNQPIDESTDAFEKQPIKSHSRRKSSVDNEDVSQSVSDTIKRYLRMARKKSVNDDAANRFKRVNYDRNLRNIRAKGEINPPGLDEDDSKATQTLDAWPLLHYNHIRGVEYQTLLDEAHADWTTALQRRTQQQQEYLQQLRDKDMKKDPGSPVSPPLSPAPHLQQLQLQASAAAAAAASSLTSAANTGLFHSGTQFFSNLWHGYHHSAHDNSNNSTTNVTTTCNTSTCTTTSNTTTLYTSATANNQSPALFNQANNNQTIAQHQQHQQQQQLQLQQSNQQQLAALNNSLAMQKSKSSSNVGQFVSKKIWKSRSKSQSRISATNKPQWSPQGNCIWTSPSGKRVTLSQSHLRDLTEIERKILHRVAIEKINQLNIGVNVTAPEDISTSAASKSQKRRPLLIKRKALTTSIFDTSKKDDAKANGSGLVFGVSIEKCIDNDHRIQKGSGGVTVGGLVGTSGGGSDRGSRNSIISLLGGGSSSKGSDHIGSCESLPSRSTHILGQYEDSGGGVVGSNSFINPSIMQISRSQSDVRRGSQDEEDLLASDAPPMVGLEQSSRLQVPAILLECIKHIEEYGMHTVGIFRVSTSKKRVRQLKEGFDRGDITLLDSEICPHDVATILKEYLRDLPEPLLCRNLYKAFIKTQKIRNRRLQFEALSHLIQLLPVAHRDTLFVLLQFLVKIARSSDDRTGDGSVIGNKMDSNNLATVFAPNILRSSMPGRNTAEQEIDEQIDVINVIRIMIDHYEDLFRVPAELMDEIYTNMMDTFPQQLDYLCEKRDIIERYDDDMDSAYSSTPLNSPPPVTLGPSGSSTGVDDSSTRPVYSRDDFLHENTIKCGSDPSGGNIAMRRRERISKMKYTENDHELARRRRRERNVDESPATATASPTKTTFNNSNNHSNRMPFETIDVNKTNKNRSASMDSRQQQALVNFHQQQQTRVSDQSRRLSSPYDGHQNTSGVVKASLKIPVQMQQQQQQTQQQQQNYCDNSGHLDLSDIPYIEDNGYGQEVLTGSLSFSGGGAGQRRDSNSSTSASTPSTMTYQIPISYDGRILNSPTSSSQSSDPTRPVLYQYDDTSAGTSATSSRRSSDNLSQPQSQQQQLQQQQQKSIFSLQSSTTSTQPLRPDSTKRVTPRKHSSNVTGEIYTNPDIVGFSAIKSASIVSGGGVGSVGGSGGGSTGLHLTNTEPKITPSISNIGGAVLRSKTADFERISKQNKKYKTTNESNSDEQSQQQQQQQQQSPTTSTTSIDENKGRPQQQQQQLSSTQVYKRQELISSAQRAPK